MSKLQTAKTAGDWERYKQIADKPSSFKTPSLSDMSSPDQNTQQRRTHHSRLLTLEARPAGQRLKYLNADIAKEVEEGYQEKAQSGDPLLVLDSTITAGTFVVSDIKHETEKAPSQQSAH